MSNQKRHKAGTPASMGGKFSADPKPPADSTLAVGEQPLRDLGVEGDLRPYVRYEADVPEGTQTLTSSRTGREILVYVEDGKVKAQAEVIQDQGWTTFENDTAAEVVADAFHQIAAFDHIAGNMNTYADGYELRDTDAVMSPSGNLIIEAMISDDDGDWTTISFNHGDGTLEVSRYGETIVGEEADVFVTETQASMLGSTDWPTQFRTAASGMANDGDIAEDVRSAAAKAGI